MAITIDGVVYRNLEDQVQYLTEMYEDLYNISTYMPSDVSTQNKLATRAYVDQSVTTVSAHYLTSDTAGNNFATKQALLSGPYYYGSEEHDPDENDYAFVNADESHSDLPSRYVFIGNEWKYQYSLSAASGVVDLTSAQTITGVKTFSNGVIFGNNGFSLSEFDANTWILKKGNTNILYGDNSQTYVNSLLPLTTNQRDLGSSSRKWKDLYINGSVFATFLKDSGGSTLATLGSEFIFWKHARPAANNTYDLGNTNNQWKDLYLSGEIVGTYKEANTVTYSSGNYVASFTSMDSTTVNKIKYIEVTLEGTTDCISFNVPVAAINMSQYSVNYEIKTNGYPVESIFILYMSNTLSIAVPHTDSTYTAHIFIKFH